jgi:rhodanese-related sulfurtransferase
MGITQSTQKIGFEDIQTVIKNPEQYLLINTLPPLEQSCLIINTVAIQNEEDLINKHLQSNKYIKIIVYGRNCTDESVVKKQQQLSTLGFTNVYIYSGGIFEWLMLQDIYGAKEFPTTSKQLDFLKYKPVSLLNVQRLNF